MLGPCTEVIDTIVADMRERSRRAEEGSPLLSPEEQAFFQSFEEEMRPFRLQR